MTMPLSISSRRLGLHLAGPKQRNCFSATSSARARWGFVGLGRMGYPMAKNLRSKMPPSDELVVYDVNAQALEAFSNEYDSNVHVAESIGDLAQSSDTIITVLPAPEHVRDAYKEMLHGPPSSNAVQSLRLFIDCSTIDPMTSSETANAVKMSGYGTFVDAPMSGGTTAAKAGSLTFMFGSSPEHVSRIENALYMMGKRAVHLGPQTAGLKGKLANNFLLAISNIATAEAMNMGIQWGLDARALGDLINTCSGRCWSSEVNNPVAGISPGAPAERDYEGGFETTLMLKDLKLAMTGAEEFGVTSQMGALASKIYADICDDKQYKGKDFSIVYQYLKNLSKDRSAP